MNLKSGFLAGVAVFAVSMLANQLIGVLYPPYMLEMQNTQVFRPYSDPLMMLFFVYPFIYGIVLSYLWSMVHPKLKGTTIWEKSAGFANLYFIVGTIPGMFITLTSMQVTFAAVVIWSAVGYLEAFTAGAVYQKVK